MEGRTEGRTDPILQDPSGQGQGSNYTEDVQKETFTTF